MITVVYHSLYMKKINSIGKVKQKYNPHLVPDVTPSPREWRRHVGAGEITQEVVSSPRTHIYTRSSQMLHVILPFIKCS